MSSIEKNQPISAEPTKTFFVEMLTRDIPLEQAVLDLVDNSVDGAKAMGSSGGRPFEGRKVNIEFDKDRFRIIDNCGGFSSEAARDYAFRFGRPAGSPRMPNSIGQFGVGMKRALFKFGLRFTVRSATTSDAWAVTVDVSEWESQNDWHFPWAVFEPDDNLSKENPGTEIVVVELRPSVSAKFSTRTFENEILALIKSKHRQFIAGGLAITVNGHHIDETSLSLLVADDPKLSPGTDQLLLQDVGEENVTVRIVVGVAHSSPREAGWYVVCNGRVILEANRTKDTGWGLIEDKSDSLMIPSFHNQFARFRGIVSFESNDSARVPWNTTKTDVDRDSPIWQKAFGRMVEMMRPVVNFLNDLENDVAEHTREQSPLLEYVSKAKSIKPEQLPAIARFTAPARELVRKGVRTVRVQYSRPFDQVEFLRHELSLSSATAVGQHTFDLIYQRMGGE